MAAHLSGKQIQKEHVEDLLIQLSQEHWVILHSTSLKFSYASLRRDYKSI